MKKKEATGRKTYTDKSININMNEQARKMLDELKADMGASSLSEAVRTLIWNAHRQRFPEQE